MATLASAHPPAVTQIAQGAGMSLLLTLLRTSDVTSNSTALGNASMCISELAKRRELLPLLRKQDAVAPLLGGIIYWLNALFSMSVGMPSNGSQPA